MGEGKTLTEILLSAEAGRRAYWGRGKELEITEMICKAMREQRISRAEMAKRMDITEQELSDLLTGDSNTVFSDLLYICWELGLDIKITKGGA